MTTTIRVLTSLAALVTLACSSAATSTQVTLAGAGPISGDATRLPTGVHLDPAGVVHPVGPMPLNVVLAPGGNRVVLMLNGWAKNGIEVVDWHTGKVTQSIELPAAFLGLAFSPDGQSLAASGGYTDQVYRFRWTGDSAVLTDSIRLASADARRRGSRYPAHLAFSPDGKRLYVVENVVDSLAVIDVASGTITQRLATGHYPYGVVVHPDGRVFVSAWGGHDVAMFSPSASGLSAAQMLPAGRHPSALLLNHSGDRLYVASASTNRIAVLDTKTGKQVSELRDPPPAGPDEGTTPNALALAPDGSRLYVAEADANAVAVFEVASGKLMGRVPTGWYPAALLTTGSSLLVANGKGTGSRANPLGPGPRDAGEHQGPSARTAQTQREGYTLGQLRGSLSILDATTFNENTLAQFSARVARANAWDVAQRTGKYPPFEHVIYVIRENRTYDQVFGDLAGADGDTSLVYFGRNNTPNAHALAERFGIFDRFFVNAEVSADGHPWSMAAYAVDYVEKRVQLNYSSRSSERGQSREEVARDDDPNAPSTGYLWTLAAKKGITLRNYGEYADADRAGHVTSKYPGLENNTNPEFPVWNLDIPDQKRADVWIAELERYVKQGSMPAFEIVRLPNDHTSGGSAGKPTPRAQVADNDLALGRIMAALTRTPFWKSTVVFVLEDDAQNGPDHVDSHRSPALVMSPYNRPGVYHRFTNTTDFIRTMEDILKLGTLSQFDYYGRPLTDIWATEPNLRPYDLLTPSYSLSEKNPVASRGAIESKVLEFDREDESDDDAFSEILWHIVKGYDRPYPGPTRMSLLEARRGR